jgi:hypothetical protein
MPKKNRVASIRVDRRRGDPYRRLKSSVMSVNRAIERVRDRLDDATGVRGNRRAMLILDAVDRLLFEDFEGTGIMRIPIQQSIDAMRAVLTPRDSLRRRRSQRAHIAAAAELYCLEFSRLGYRASVTSACKRVADALTADGYPIEWKRVSGYR